MFRKMNLIVALIATLLLAATNASSQTSRCNCSNASLVGDTVGTRFNLGPGPINKVVGTGIELPGAGPVLGAAGPSPRWNFDFGSDTIRIDFLQQPATYGMGSYFTFSSLDPQLAGCPPAFISGITVTTNKPTSQFNVVAAATFGPHTVTIQIAPNSANLDWQPGEFILVKLNFACATGSQGNDCRGNRVTNGNFTSGLNGWSAAYGTPDYSNSMGAQDPGFVGMWGNMNPTIGEGLQQNLGANQLVSGKTYLVSLQVRRLNDKNKLPYAKFKVRASTAPLSSAAGGITVGLTGNITATTWTPISFNWTAPAGGPFQFLTLSVENNSSVNDGSKTSYGHFDNICIRETPSLPCCECLGKVTTLDLSTITSNNWTVTDTNNVTSPVVLVSPIHSAWNLNTGPAKWVSTSAAGGSANLVGGTYDYKVNFVVPRCAIERRVTLSGNYGGDDDIFVYLDNTTTPNLISKCTGGWCFNTQNQPIPFSNFAVSPGNHTLIVRVVNSSASPTGMFINANLTGTCRSELTQAADEPRVLTPPQTETIKRSRN